MDLIGEPFDLVVRAGELADSGLVAHLLMQVPRYLYAAPAYLQTQGTPATPAALAAHRCLRFQGTNAWQLFADDAVQEVAIASAYSANSIGLLQRLAVQGMGYRAFAGNWGTQRGCRRATSARVARLAGKQRAGVCADGNTLVASEKPLFY